MKVSSYMLGIVAVAAAASPVVQVVSSSRDNGDRFAKKPDLPFSAGQSNAPSAAATVLTIDPKQTFQEILGFGGAFTEATGLNIQKLSADKQQQIIDSYFGDPATSLGYSMCRVHMNSCDFSLASYSCDDVADDFQLEHFNIDHDHKYLIPTILAAQNSTAKAGKRDLKLFFSPWSPPAWMKTNGQMDGSDHPGLKADAKYHAAWALHFSKFAQAYQDAGVKLWGCTVQNEPAFAAPWEACAYTPQQEADFVKDHLGPQLNSTHPDLKIMIWDHNRDLVQDWAKTILTQPEVAKWVAGTAFHWYTGNSPGLNLYENLDAAHFVDPTKFLLATEATYCPGVERGSWVRGEAYGIDILNDMLHWSTGWVDWNMVLDEQGGPNHLNNYCDAPVIVHPANNTFSFQPTYYFLGHFSKFVPPGSRRVAISQSQGQVCRVRPEADSNAVCSALQWACQHMACAAGLDSCDPKVLTSNADTVFDQWYQSHKLEGPSACDFSGVAVLEGLQVAAFLNPDNSLSAVVLNVGDREADFQISTQQHTASGAIPAHSVQSLRWQKF